ncbi:MAG: hypothetical protein WCJ40_06245, partial [Planctomycetota bacterium]
TPAGVQDLMSRRPVVSSLGLLNHRLLAPDAFGIVSIKNLPFMAAKSILLMKPISGSRLFLDGAVAKLV